MNNLLMTIFKNKSFRKYWLEVVLLTIALAVAIVSWFIFLSDDKRQKMQQQEVKKETVENDIRSDIYFDVSGAVKNPGLYKASYGIRLEEAIRLAGGISENADKDFFIRNFNLAKVVSDQEKIYIPSILDLNNGYFEENTRTLNYNNSSSKINLNEATIEELDVLPGVGKITAQKIIDQRPYGALEELVNKKIISKNSFEKIKNLVEI